MPRKRKTVEIDVVPDTCCSSSSSSSGEESGVDDPDNYVIRWRGVPLQKHANGDVYYSSFEREELVFSLGDVVMVDGGEDDVLFVARIDSLWEDSNHKFWFLARWYYRPEDTKVGRLSEHLLNEVFETNEFDENELNTIVGPGQVVSKEQYALLSGTEKAKENIFVCRYHYNTTDTKFLPLIAGATPTSAKKRKRESMVSLATPFQEKEDDDFPVYGHLEDEDKFVRASVALHLSYVPRKMLCRETEETEITALLTQAITKGRLSGCLYVSGVPGTGKTATIQSIIRKLRQKVFTEELPDFNYVEINAQRLPHPTFLYALLWEAMSGQYATPTQALELLDRRFKSHAKKQRCCVLLVDELDHLVTAKQNVLYNLFDWPTRPNTRLVVIGVANTMDLPERMLPRVASRLGLRRVSFKPYTSDQIRMIVQQRLLGLDAFDDSAIELISRKVAAASGDIRKALQIAAGAALVAKNDEKAKTVGLGHVQAAISDMDRSPNVQFLQNSALIERLFIVATLLEIKANGLPEIPVVSIIRRVTQLCEPLGVSVPSFTSILSIAHRLSSARAIEFQGKPKCGVAQKIVLNLQPQDISFALRSDPLLSRWV